MYYITVKYINLEDNRFSAGFDSAVHAAEFVLWISQRGYKVVSIEG